MKGSEVSFAKKLNRVTHALKMKMMHILRYAGIKSVCLIDKYNDTYDSCDICASIRRSNHKVKICLSHANEAFIECIQKDFAVCTLGIKNMKF